MVSIGHEGSMAQHNQTPILSYKKLHRSKNIDYLTIHIWPQNWGWYDPAMPQTLKTAKKNTASYLKQHIKIAKQLKKPLVLEEFGLARDSGSYAVNSSTEDRDSYYEYIFDWINTEIKAKSLLVGCNFWAWAGMGKPSHPKSIWKKGDDLIGDPPHEYQGWYSVYNTDSSTINLLKRYADRFNPK